MNFEMQYYWIYRLWLVPEVGDVSRASNYPVTRSKTSQRSSETNLQILMIERHSVAMQLDRVFHRIAILVFLVSVLLANLGCDEVFGECGPVGIVCCSLQMRACEESSTAHTVVPLDHRCSVEIDRMS